MSDSRIPAFDEREKGYERKFQHDQELAFRVRVRRNKHFGLWAAARMGLQGEAAENYAQDLVTMSLTHRGDDATIANVACDLAAEGATHDAVQLRRELERCAAEARRHLGVNS